MHPHQPCRSTCLSTRRGSASSWCDPNLRNRPQHQALCTLGGSVLCDSSSSDPSAAVQSFIMWILVSALSSSHTVYERGGAWRELDPDDEDMLQVSAVMFLNAGCEVAWLLLANMLQQLSPCKCGTHCTVPSSAYMPLLWCATDAVL